MYQWKQEWIQYSTILTKFTASYWVISSHWLHHINSSLLATIWFIWIVCIRLSAKSWLYDICCRCQQSDLWASHWLTSWLCHHQWSDDVYSSSDQLELATITHCVTLFKAECIKYDTGDIIKVSAVVDAFPLMSPSKSSYDVVVLELSPELCTRYCPLLETMGALGEEEMDFISDLGCQLAVTTGELQFTAFLFQHLSVTIHRGKCHFRDWNLGPIGKTRLQSHWLWICAVFSGWTEHEFQCKKWTESWS